MPFMLYDVLVGPSSQTYRYTGRTIRLAGSSGPLASVQKSLNTALVSPFPWHASGGDIVSAVGGHSSQAIVIDLKPKVAQNVSLYILRDVWGYSESNWTPLALLLECLFNDHQCEDPEKFKNEFADGPSSGKLYGEFLYVQGGVDHGTWNWGQAGRVNGAILEQPAFDYLSTQLGQALRGKAKPPTC